jgi:alpha-methylacyl-CoA racemase
MAGPLEGLKIVEFESHGPGPFGSMVLADLGAEIVRVSRVADVDPSDDETDAERMARGHRRNDVVTRGRPSVAIDLKHPDGVATALRLVDRADVLIEGYRPGVMERLGLGPDVCTSRNPRLVYARMTGWGQEGPYANVPGHDINYVALGGALGAFGRDGEAPIPPLNLIGDYGGGGMLLAIGVLSALFERSVSGRGQVIDTAMVDGVALLTTTFYGMRADGVWSNVRGTNTLDMGTPFYNVYETADGRYLTLGGGEPQFYSELLNHLGLRDELLPIQHDRRTWPDTKARLAAVFKTKTLAEWREELEGTQTCFAPVLTFDDAPTHPHNVARQTFVERNGVVQPAPAPRFGRTPAHLGSPPAVAGQHTVEVLRGWGLEPDEIDALLAAGAIAQAHKTTDPDRERENA